MCTFLQLSVARKLLHYNTESHYVCICPSNWKALVCADFWSGRGGAALTAARVHNSVQLYNPQTIQAPLTASVSKDLQLRSHKRPEYLILQPHPPFISSFITPLCGAFKDLKEIHHSHQRNMYNSVIMFESGTESTLQNIISHKFFICALDGGHSPHLSCAGFHSGRINWLISLGNSSGLGPRGGEWRPSSFVNHFFLRITSLEQTSEVLREFRMIHHEIK